MKTFFPTYCFVFQPSKQSIWLLRSGHKTHVWLVLLVLCFTFLFANRRYTFKVGYIFIYFVCRNIDVWVLWREPYWQTSISRSATVLSDRVVLHIKTQRIKTNWHLGVHKIHWPILLLICWMSTHIIFLYTFRWANATY